MFYIIRFVLCNLLLTLPTIYILIKLKKKFANSKTNTNADYTRTAKKPIEIKKAILFLLDTYCVAIFSVVSSF